jgi:hypothetical protein
VKNYFEFRGLVQRIVYNPLSGAFTTKHVRHPFEVQSDPLTRQMLDDVGLSADAPEQLARKFAA